MAGSQLARKRVDELIAWINSEAAARASIPAGWDEAAWTNARAQLPSRIDDVTDHRAHDNGIAAGWVESDLGPLRLCCAVEDSVVIGLSVRPAEDVRPWDTIAPTAFAGDEPLGGIALQFARTSEIPGCVVGKATGDVVAIACCGYSVLSELKPMTLDSPFRLSSVTKVLTTIAVLCLVRNRHLSLDTSIGDLVGIRTLHTVTVQHLLSHTSGLKFDGWVHVAEGEPELRIEECSIDEVDPPGTQRRYGNQGFALLGRAIEKCTTQRWADHIRQTILTPLGARSTVLSDTEGFLDGYVDEAGAIVPEDRYTPGYGAAAAGWTTAADLLAIGQALVEPDRGLVDDATLSLINREYASVTSAVTQGLGLLRFTARRGDVLFHSGGWPGWSTALAVRVSDRTVAVVGANRSVEARSEWPRLLLGSA